jgi:hypothetical protein
VPEGRAEADGLAVADGVALGAAEPLGVGVAEADGVAAAGWSWVVFSTARKRRTAGATRERNWSALDPPATLTSMLRSPWVITSGSETPVALTRLAMIWRACSIFALSGALPLADVADKVIVVPPWRSSPSLG